MWVEKRHYFSIFAECEKLSLYHQGTHSTEEMAGTHANYRNTVRQVPCRSSKWNTLEPLISKHCFVPSVQCH